MLPLLKAGLALFSLLELISSRPLMTTSPRLKLSEITHRIQQLNSGVQVPCNDTRVAQVAFTDRKLSEQELLCQAATALTKVTKCKKDYEPFIVNLQSLHGKKHGPHSLGLPTGLLEPVFISHGASLCGKRGIVPARSGHPGPWGGHTTGHSQNCSLSHENEIYLRNFLPELGNFTQGMYRRLAASAAQ
ncbi:uncharacterized protein O9250_007768 [Rhynochetos jubatus]